MQPALLPTLALLLIFTHSEAVQPIVASLSSSMNRFIHHLESICTIFDKTNYVTWFASFWHFFYRFMVGSLFSRMTLHHSGILVIQRDLLRIKPSREWLLMLAILSISEPIQFITLTKAISDKWASMYGYDSNIYGIVKVYEQLFKVEQSRHPLQDYYASICELLT